MQTVKMKAAPKPKKTVGATKKVELTAEEKVELKQLICMGVSKDKLMKRYKISKQQYTAYQITADKQRDEILKTIPKAPEGKVPVVVIPVAIGDMLDSHEEIRLVLQITK